MRSPKEIQLVFRNPYYIVPPGSLRQHLDHPAHRRSYVELALFQEHRYAFFYWAQWTRKRAQTPPSLVSLDWHQDLCHPNAVERKWLDQLDLEDDSEVAAFCWATLAGTNDGHILAAAYLNLIGNVYVHCRQGTLESSWEDEHLTDRYGNVHTIRKFKTPEEFENSLLESSEQAVYFDLDLDFFTYQNRSLTDSGRFTYMKKPEIVALLAPDTTLMHWIFQRLAGFTIATEPEHCGGLTKSNQLLNIVNKLYFTPDLFAGHCTWRHLRP